MPHHSQPCADGDAALRARLEELRSLGRLLAGDGDPIVILRTIAENVRVATGSLAVHIERQRGSDPAGEVVVAAGPGGGADTRNLVVEGTSRVVIALGRRSERVGNIVLFRRSPPPVVDAATLERITDLATFATLALRQVSMFADIGGTRDECRRIVEDKYRLISGVGEELKDRLGAAVEYVRLLETESELNEREKHYIERSQQAIQAVVRVINDLIQLSRIDTGQVAFQPEPSNVGALLRGLVRDFQLAVGTIGLQFDVSVPDDLPAVPTDLDFVRQILDTLLTNAVRFSPVGGRIAVEADVRPGRRKSDPQGYVCLAVTDVGPGVGDSELIFEEVYRVERRGEKPGFRLAIARRMARLLGGELTLESSPGQGSRFTLWLPDTPPEDALSYAELKQDTDAALLGRS